MTVVTETRPADENGLFPGGQREMREGDRTISVLGRAGDTKLIWDAENEEEVEAAKETFKRLVAKGFLAYKAEGKDGRKGEQIKKFDAEAERIILVPQMAGG